MANLGALQYGDFHIFSGIDSNASGQGNLYVTGTTSLYGASTSISGTLAVTGGTTLSSTLGVTGISTLAGRAIITDTTTSTSSTTGAFTVAGGAGIAGAAYLGTSLFMKQGSWTSAGTDVVISGNNDTVKLRTSSGSAAGEFESTTTAFNFKTVGGSPYSTLSIDKTTGYISVATTTDSTELNTGAFQVAGGASIAKQLWVGTDATVNGNFAVLGDVTFTGLVSTSGDNAVTFTNTTESESTTTGSVLVAGGIGIEKSVFVGGLGRFVNTTQSTSVSTGAVVISGGLGVAKDTFIAGILTVTNTANSTSTGTGSIVAAGGLGIAKDFYLGGLARFTNVTDSSSISTGAFVVDGGVGIAKNISIGGDAAVTGVLGVTGTASFLDATNSTSYDTGAVTISGGLGVAGAVFLGSTDNSTSSTTGGLVLSGGLGIALDTTMGGNLKLAGTNPVVTFNNSGSAVPTFTTSSAGTRLILNKSVSGSSVDYAFGISASTLWSSIPMNTSTYKFNWYGGTTSIMNLDGLGNLVVNGTADATSTSTGAFILAGGAGIAQSVFIGGNLTVQSTSWTSTGTDAYINADTDSLFLRNTAGSNSGEFESSLTHFNFRTATGLPFVTLGIAKATGIVSIYQTDTATGNNTGALQVYGGASVTKDLWVGGNTTVVGDLLVTGSISTTGDEPVTFTNTTNSTSATTGGVIIYGGLGIVQDVYVGGTVHILDTTVSSSATTGAFVVAGGIGIGSASTFGSTINILDTTDSTSPTSGAVTIAGGVGIAKSLFVGSTTQSTSATTGGVVLSGGLGVAKNIFLGGLSSYTTTSLAAPAFTTQSIGTRIVLNSQLSATQVDYALGMNTNTLWTSVPMNTSTYLFNWYGGTTSVMTLDGLGNLVVNGTADATSTSTGALILAGGAGILKSVFIGGNVTVKSTSWTSTGTDAFLNADTDTIALRNTAGVTDGQFESTLTDFNFVTVGETPFTTLNIDKETGAVTVFVTTTSTGDHTGALQVYGGASISKDLWVGGNTTVIGDLLVTGSIGTTGEEPVTFSNLTNSTSVTTGAVIISGGLGIAKDVYIGGSVHILDTTVSVSPTTGAFIVAGGIGIGDNSTFGGIVTVVNTTISTSATTGAVVVTGGLGVGGDVWLGADVNIASQQTFSATGLAAPTFTTQSIGTRIVLNTQLSATQVDFALGMNTNTLWTSVPMNTNTYSFAWYGGTTSIMTLNGLGNLAVNGTADASSTSTGAFVLAGGAGIASSVYIGGNFNVKSTSWTSTGTNALLNAAGNTIALRNTAGVTDGQFESTTTQFNFVTVGETPFTTLNIDKETGIVSVLVTTNATANQTGALQVAGGASISKDLWVVGTTTIEGGLIVSGSIDTVGDAPVTFSNTTDSDAVSTGSVIVAGGMGIAKSMFIGGALHVLDTTASTSVSTGAFIVGGGIGIGGDSTIGGITTFTNITNSTSTTTGAVIISGGVGIAKDTTIGGNVALSGTNPLLSFANSGVAAPTFTTLSAGTRLIFNTQLSATKVDYSMGMDAFTLWSALPMNTTTYKFNWYGGTTSVMTLDGAGNVVVNGTTNSTSSSTGAFILAGGAGIAQDVFLGASLHVQSGSWTSTGDDILLNANTASILLRNTVDESDGQFESNLTDFNFYTTTDPNYVTLGIKKATGIVSIFTTTTATADHTGALQVYGGASISKDLWVGGTTTLIGDLLVSGSISTTGEEPVTFSNLTNSTSVTTGGVIISGGLGIAKDVYIGGSVHILDTTASTSVSTGAFIVAGGIGIGGDSTLGGIVSFTNTTESISTSTGAVVVTGGLGVSGSVWLGADLNVASQQIFGSTDLAAPTFTTQSIGTRIVLNTQLSATKVDFAVGMNTNTLWTSVPMNTNTYLFNWYGGTTSIMTLNGLGNLAVNGTADATSTSTGAFVLAGGAGIAASVYIGGNLNVKSGSWTSTGTDAFLNAATDTIALRNAAGVTDGQFESTTTNFNFVTVGASPFTTLNINKTTGIVSVFQTDTATANNTGALQVYGGVSVTKDIWVGGDTVIIGDLTVSGSISTDGSSPVEFSNTTDSESPSTGGVVMHGGLGIAKSVYIGGGVHILDTTVSTSVGTGAFTVAGGIGVGADSTFGGIVTIVNTTDATTPTSGAFVVAGGVGIAESLFVGSTNDSSSASSGGVVLSGGLGVAKSATFGGNVSLSGTNPLVTFANSGLAAPTFTTQSAGTRIVLNTQLSATKVDFALGMNTNHLWSSVPMNTTTYKFNWYGGTTSVMTLDGLGNLVVNGTTDSTSASTGAFILAGGAGIASSVYIGGNINIKSTSWTSTGNTIALNANSDTILLRNAAGNDSGEFASTMTDFNFKTTDVTPAVAVNIAKATGIVTINTTDNAVADATGALIVTGGVGVGADLWVTGAATVNGAATFVSAVSVTDATESSSVTTGAFIVAGGVGIAKKLFVGGIASFTDTTPSTSTTTGALLVAGGIGVVKDSTFGGYLAVTAGTDSTSPTTGAVMVTGGVGIAKSLFVGSTTNSTDVSTGSVVISGGAGIAKDVFIGGNITQTGTNPLHTWTASGVGAPTFSTRSAGVKLNLVSGVLDGTHADYAIGIDTDVLWFGLPQNNATQKFKWYGGITELVSLTGTGIMTLLATTDSSSSTTGTLVVSGGVGVAGKAYFGSELHTTGVSTFTGAMTANATLLVAGVLTISNTTESTATNDGALVVAGGTGIAKNLFVGGNANVTGNTGLTGTLTVGGIVTLNNATESTTTANGALILAGGAGIAKNVNVGGALTVTGDATVNGNFFVNGTRTEIDSAVVSIEDNVLLLNNGPSGTADSGLGMKRYQYANDLAAGDVITNDTAEHTGTAASGTTTTIVLANTSSLVDGWYEGGWILITGGTGEDQVRRIKTYVGSTHTATIYTTADQTSLAPVPIEGLDFTTAPDNTSTYAIFTGQYVLSIWDEINGEFGMGTSPLNPVSDPNVPIRNRLTLHAGTARLEDHLYVDAINEYTANAGVTIEGILVKDNALTNVTSINGNAVDTTNIVQLIDNDSGDTVVLPSTNKYGAYMVLVTDVVTTGASATFLISGNIAHGGSIFRVTGTLGANGEHLGMTWPLDDYPQLKWQQLPSGGTGAFYSYRVKLMTV